MKMPSASEVAEMWGKHRHTIQAMCRNGDLHAFKKGGVWWVDVEKSVRALNLKFGNQFAKELTKKHEKDQKTKAAENSPISSGSKVTVLSNA
jgi:Helix-turn-helix domain